jgi:phosphomannomutase
MIKDKIDLPPGGSAVAKAALEGVAEEISKSYPSARIDRRDGLHARMDDTTWLHLRASNTEPIVRILLEAAGADQAESLRQSAHSMIRRALG